MTYTINFTGHLDQNDHDAVVERARALAAELREGHGLLSASMSVTGSERSEYYDLLAEDPGGPGEPAGGAEAPEPEAAAPATDEAKNEGE